MADIFVPFMDVSFMWLLLGVAAAGLTVNILGYRSSYAYKGNFCRSCFASLEDGKCRSCDKAEAPEVPHAGELNMEPMSAAGY